MGDAASRLQAGLHRAALPVRPDQPRGVAGSLDGVDEGTEKAVHFCFGNYGGQVIQQGTWTALVDFLNELHTEGVTIERKHFRDIDELLGVCQWRLTIGGYDVPVANLPYTLTNDAGHKMAEGEPFAACYYDKESGRVFSLRSTDSGLDVSAIAKSYGGGGHMHAAGFQVPRDHELATS